MRLFKKILVSLVSVMLLAAGSIAYAQEAPDVLVKRISQEVLDAAKADKDIQGGNKKKVLELVELKVLPYVNFQHMTALAAGRFWREATPEQQKALTNEFRALLVYTYSGAINQIRDQKLEFKPLIVGDSPDEALVRSQVIQPRGDPIQLNYRLEKLPSGWKIYDVNVLGAWLVETYKGNFSAEISRGGMDGLIQALAEKNKKLAANAQKSGK
jgi:phospholipid transport system substrate-binding protein